MEEKIPIIEDEEKLARFVELELVHEGYRVEKAMDGRDALEMAERGDYGLILLDVMLPGMSGMELLRRLRRTKQTPVIMVTARDAVMDKVTGLDMGADDYISKPFNPMELVARVKSQLRRYTDLGDINTRSDNVIVNGRLTFKLDEHVLYADGEPVKLTATETKIVELLMKHPGRIFPAEEIYSRIWNEPAYSAENTVMVHIRRIREKIELNPSEPEYLKVVWGIGYEIEKH